MICDNPAARLLAILEAGKQYANDKGCKAVWRELLGVNRSDDALLMLRLGKLMGLPSLIIKIIEDDFPGQIGSFEYWSQKVNSAFSVQNLNSTWQAFNSNIDEHTLLYLRLTAGLIETKNPTVILQDETVEELRKRIDQLMVELVDSALDSEVKGYVARSLRKIINALDEYHISGVVPIFEVVESAFGHAFFDESYRMAMSETDVGRQFFDILSAVASAVTIALGFPQLPQTMQLLLERFKS